MFKPPIGSERKIVFQTFIFMAGPLFVFSYSHLSSPLPLNLFAIGLSIAWIYLSVEDALRLSVPTRSLYVVCSLTCFYAILQQNPLWDYFLLALFFSCIFLTIWLFQYLRTKKVMGSADFLVIISLGLSLEPHMVGPWLVIACSIPLVGLVSRRKSQSEKLPFIPYLTVGWMLASTLN